MLKTKVSCWFCNEDSHVFVFNKNSWTCPKCEQYNGFTKDGDYNRKIPEMQIENREKKFCQSSSSNSSSSNASLLCDKCNQNQEMKLAEMKNFESSVNEKSEREYAQFKKKIDHIYDICKPCKIKLNNHLKIIDQQIGSSYAAVRQRHNHQHNQGPSAAAVGNNTASLKPASSSTASPSNKTENRNLANQDLASSICDNFKSTFQKAYTIAGTVPGYVFSSGNGKSRSGSGLKLKYEIAPAADAALEETISYDNEKSCVYETVANKSSPARPSKDNSSSSSSNKISCDSLTIVAEDLLVLLVTVLVFACDLVNLINDSGVLQLEKNTNYEWFVSLLELYKQIIALLVFVNVLSVHLAYKRPKLSRFLMMFGFVFNLVIHFQVFEFKTEEQFITEVFISFFLTAYLAIARFYNCFQLVRYIGII